MTWVNPGRWGWPNTWPGMPYVPPTNPYVPPQPRTIPVPAPYPVPPRTEIVDCAACEGTGLRKSSGALDKICPGCNGAGKQRV